VPHYFYFARCADGSLYAGSTNDLKAREAKHNAGKGAKYTRARLPITIIYSEEFATVNEALKREAEVKKWKREKKMEMIEARVL
jgi:putative endonuclease